jgi:hypothetical protein
MERMEGGVTDESCSSSLPKTEACDDNDVPCVSPSTARRPDPRYIYRRGSQTSCLTSLRTTALIASISHHLASYALSTMSATSASASVTPPKDSIRPHIAAAPTALPSPPASQTKAQVTQDTLHVATAPIVLPTPPASQEHILRSNYDAPISPSKVCLPPLCDLPPITKLDREARAANYVLTFGKYKMWCLNEVAKVEPAYIQSLKRSGAADPDCLESCITRDQRVDLMNALIVHDRQVLRALREKYPGAQNYKFIFGKHFNERIGNVPTEYLEFLIFEKHHMWSKRPGLREALLYWDESASLGRENWHRRNLISKEERDAGIRGASCRRERKKEVRRVVVAR